MRQAAPQLKISEISLPIHIDHGQDGKENEHHRKEEKMWKRAIFPQTEAFGADSDGDAVISFDMRSIEDARASQHIIRRTITYVMCHPPLLHQQNNHRLGREAPPSITRPEISLQGAPKSLAPEHSEKFSRNLVMSTGSSDCILSVRILTGLHRQHQCARVPLPKESCT